MDPLATATVGRNQKRSSDFRTGLPALDLGRIELGSVARSPPVLPGARWLADHPGATIPHVTTLVASRRRGLLGAALSALLATLPRLASAEGTDVQAYGARIDLAAGIIAPRPGVKDRALRPTGPIVVGSSRFEAVEQRAASRVGGGTIKIEEHDARTGALRRSWVAASHGRFYDEARVELRAEPGAIVVDVHFLTSL